MPPVSRAKHTPASIRNISDVLDSASKQLAAVADRMSDHDVQVVYVKYQKELERGLRGVSGFAHAAFSALHDSLEDKGHFIAPQEQLEKKIRTLEADLKKAKKRIEELEG